jgi:DNA-binding beta-propeller fold protein YncE
VVAPSGAADFEGAGAYDDFSGLYYVVDNVGNAYAVDPISGDYAPLPAVTAPNGESFTGLEFDPATGDLFAVSTDGAGNSSISIIDPITGDVTLIGNTFIVLAVAMAMSSLGDYIYVLDVDTDMIMEVNKHTGTASPLGSIGFDCNFGQGMFLSAAGQIYLTAFNNDTFRSELRMLNQNTGATSLISPIGDTTFPGQTLQFAWASVFKSILGNEDREITTFALFPNPTSELLNVSHIDDLERIVISNMAGQIVMDQQIKGQLNTIDVSILTSGMYSVHLTTASGTATRQLIKK